MNYDPELFRGVHECRLCKLSELRLESGMLAVPGLPGSKYQPGGLAVIAEAPGADEEQAGTPLVGKAGKLFNEMLTRAMVQRDGSLLLNRIRCRPPANRIKDWPEAVSNCDVWTASELRTYQPLVVVLLGATAISGIFGAKAKVGTTRGTFTSKGDGHAWGARTYTATYHPSAVLRNGGINSELATQVIADLKAAEQVRLELLAGKPF